MLQYRIISGCLIGAVVISAANFAPPAAVLVLLLAISALAVAFTRSPAAGGLLVLPMVLAILLTYLCLVLFGIDYGIAVSMFPTLVVGLAVDFAIHAAPHEESRHDRYWLDCATNISLAAYLVVSPLPLRVRWCRDKRRHRSLFRR